ncbi:hypothetical protein IDH44_17850 [Paenibacillus sp. IB182496]|uniref:Uncharacterized protein n=1 Tax=Paenibacillus sabuli TaxID=2772509 RepID=A0A927GTG2_9BACL|nr:hypothetical protein [Paenibacillus sabuli]MBD2847065.1 hypothetical protein [Paenibacillus sabuli]
MIESCSYAIRVQLRSEAIFSSGEKAFGLVQSKALTDPDGFVYFHAKSLKGQLKREAFWLLKQYMQIDQQRAASFCEHMDFLFGLNPELELKKDKYKPLVAHLYERQEDRLNVTEGKMKLGHLELPRAVRHYYKSMLEQDEEQGYVRISSHDLTAAQTERRVGIQLEEAGSARKKHFTSYHAVKEGLIFYAPVHFMCSPSCECLDDLVRIVAAFRHIGASIHRGRGEVEANLLCNDEPLGLSKGGQ